MRFSLILVLLIISSTVRASTDFKGCNGAWIDYSQALKADRNRSAEEMLNFISSLDHLIQTAKSNIATSDLSHTDKEIVLKLFESDFQNIDNQIDKLLEAIDSTPRRNVRGDADHLDRIVFKMLTNLSDELKKRSPDTRYEDLVEHPRLVLQNREYMIPRRDGSHGISSVVFEDRVLKDFYANRQSELDHVLT